MICHAGMLTTRTQRMAVSICYPNNGYDSYPNSRRGIFEFLFDD